MFDDISAMVEFILIAPYFLAIGFTGSFVLTFSTVKLSQSDTIYEWFTTKIEVWRAKQARKIRREMAADIAAFLCGRKPKELSRVERKIYHQLLESYGAKMDRLHRGRHREDEDEPAK